MHNNTKSVLLVSMPFAGTAIPAIQLPLLAGYCKEHGINVQTRHLYLKAAEMYGIPNYTSLIYPPNDSYSAQMVFSRYVFPDHWKNNETRFKEYYQKMIAHDQEMQNRFPFETYVEKTDQFLEWVLQNLEWRSHDIIGFTLNYGQLLPSLAVAKKIKEQDSIKHIVLGGSRTVDQLGVNVLRAFPYVDTIVWGDGEEALCRLASGIETAESIPGVITRKNNDIRCNQPGLWVDLNTLPFLNYDQFYTELQQTKGEVGQYFQYYGRLPVEISRGCWWNHCTFCNTCLLSPRYREKRVERIVEEIQQLSEQYKMLDFQIIGNTLPKKDSRQLFHHLKEIGHDFSFVAEARAAELQSDEYTLMKEAGFNIIQTGIESFSPSYLKKMNKGTRVIDNLAALKFCQENDIKNSYNLIIEYPNEEIHDFEETKYVVSLIQSYLDPPLISSLRVMYGSMIQRHPEQFNIASLEYASIDRLIYPEEVLAQGICYVFGFTQKEQHPPNPWKELVETWRQERYARCKDALTKQTTLDRWVFYYVDGGSFLKIYDKRKNDSIKIFVLSEIERQIFLACTNVITYQSLLEQFCDFPEFEISAILQSFETNGLVYREDTSYLALPLRYRVISHEALKKTSSVEVAPVV